MAVALSFAGSVVVLKTAAGEPAPFARLGGAAALGAALAAAGAAVHTTRLNNKVTAALLSDAFRAEETPMGTLRNLAWCTMARGRGIELLSEAAAAQRLGVELLAAPGKAPGEMTAFTAGGIVNTRVH